jgi:hypothetical protein
MGLLEDRYIKVCAVHMPERFCAESVHQSALCHVAVLLQEAVHVLVALSGLVKLHEFYNGYPAASANAVVVENWCQPTACTATSNVHAGLALPCPPAGH